jgi:hypothetical protein
MIAIGILREAIITTYQSMFLKDETPLSLMLISETDHGKSSIMLNLLPDEKQIDAEVLTDTTAMGLYQKLQAKSRPCVIIIPDFHSVVSHRASVSEGTITAFLSILQEGVMKIAVGPNMVLSLNGKKASLITGMTPGFLSGRAGRWRKLGFLRRVLPLNYTYTNLTTKAIHDSIRKGEYAKDKANHFICPIDKPRHVIIPAPIDQAIQNLSVSVASQLENRGFTCHKFFRVYCQARALLRKADKVIEADFEDLNRIVPLVNLETPFQL